MDERDLVEVQMSREEILALHWEKQNMSLNILEWVREKSWLCQHHPSLPSKHSLGLCKSAHDFSHGRKEEWVGEHLAFPAVWNSAKDTSFSLMAARVLTWKLHEEGKDQGVACKIPRGY